MLTNVKIIAALRRLSLTLQKHFLFLPLCEYTACNVKSERERERKKRFVVSILASHSFYLVKKCYLWVARSCIFVNVLLSETNFVTNWQNGVRFG